MKKKVTIYHNPRCSKSREALQILKERGIEPEIIEYLVHPPSANEFKRLVQLLRIAPQELLRTKEPAYEELGLSSGSTLDELATAVERRPILLERPVIVAGGQAVIGRPAARVLEIIEE